MREYWNLFKQTGLNRQFWLLLALRCPFDALHTLTQVYLLRSAFDAISNGDANALIYACVGFLLSCLLLFLYNGTVWVLFTRCATRITARVKKRVFLHIASMRPRDVEKRSVGEWMTRAQSDVSAALAIVNESLQLPHAACAIVSTLCSSIVLFFLDPSIFGVTMAFILPHMLIAQLVVARPMTRYGIAVQKASAVNSADLNAMIVCKDVAVSYDAEDFLFERLAQSSRELMRSRMFIRLRTAIGQALLPLLAMSGYLTLLICGAGWIRDSVTTFGGLTAAFQLRGGIIKGISMLLACLARIAASVAGAHRVRETLQMKKEAEVNDHTDINA